MKVRKGDNVIVISGKDRGKSGTVVRAFPKQDRVLIDGINLVKRHERSRQRGGKGQITTKPSPVHVSNVAVKDAKSGKPTRVGYAVEGDKKTRVAKKSGAKIS